MSDLITEEGLDLLEKQEKVKSGYLLLPMELVKPNSRNPNKMSDLEFSLLKKKIDECDGNKNGPIVVRKHPELEGQYQIIDGYHRYTAMKELGFEEIICTIDECDTANAILKTVSYNKHRGELDEFLMASLVHSLVVDYGLSYDDIQNAWGYTHAEIKSMEDTTDFDIDKYNEEDAKTISTIPTESKINLGEKIVLKLTEKQSVEMKMLLKNMGIKDNTVAILAALKYFDDQMVTTADKQELVEWVASLGSSVTDLELDSMSTDSYDFESL